MITTIILTALAYFLFWGICYTAAYFDFGFTIVNNGELVIAAYNSRRDSHGKRLRVKVRRWLANIEGHHVDPKTGEVTKGEIFSFFEQFWGISWMGIPLLTVRHQFPLMRKKLTEVNGKHVIQGRIGEEVNSLYYQAEYPAQLEAAETSEQIPISLLLSLTLSVLNGNQVVFNTADISKKLESHVSSFVRPLIGASTLKQINRGKYNTGVSDPNGYLIEKDIVKAIEEYLASKKSKTFLGLNGDPRDENEAKLIQYDIVGPQADEIQKKLLAQLFAEQQTVVEKQRAIQIEMIGTAEAEAKQKMKEAEQAGVVIRVRAYAKDPKLAHALALSEAIAAHQGPLYLGTSLLPTLGVNNPQTI